MKKRVDALIFLIDYTNFYEFVDGFFPKYIFEVSILNAMFLYQKYKRIIHNNKTIVIEKDNKNNRIFNFV